MPNVVNDIAGCVSTMSSLQLQQAALHVQDTWRTVPRSSLQGLLNTVAIKLANAASACLFALAKPDNLSNPPSPQACIAAALQYVSISFWTQTDNDLSYFLHGWWQQQACCIACEQITCASISH